MLARVRQRNYKRTRIPDDFLVEDWVGVLLRYLRLTTYFGMIN